MIVNTNIASLNAQRNLAGTNSAMQKSLEKLSSGYRINKAADDAAGLAISEKMRGQINGLNQAVSNAQSAISLIQTGEGALNESHSILQRMRELAVQSSNDTNTAADRDQIQKEMDQLSKELTRIGNTTEFNTQKLLDGSFTGKFQIGANEGQNIQLSVNDMRGFKLGVAGDVQFSESANSGTVNSGGTFTSGATYTVDGNDLKDSDGNVVATSTDGKTWKGAAASGDKFVFADKVVDGTKITFTSASAVSGTVSTTNNGFEAGEYTISSGSVLDENGTKVGSYASGTITGLDGKTLMSGISGTIGASGSFTVGGIGVYDQDKANAAITKINTAIETVSTERAKLGAYQNRLEHTINNLSTASENLTAAESGIRDVDMAAEMSSFTKSQILSQAGVAMLAQANQTPQAVLKLLG